jgi:serine/threonine protein kinase
VHLSTLLPHLDVQLPHEKQIHFRPAEQEPTAVDLIQRLLVYPPDSRFKAADALKHPWLLNDGPLVLPQAALEGSCTLASTAETLDGRMAGEWLKLFLAPGLQ